MLRKDLPTSTAAQDVYLDGLSGTRCMTLSSHRRFEFAGGQISPYEMTGPDLLRLVTTSQHEEVTVGKPERLLCRILVETLPDKGLAEALESLREILEFYREEPGGYEAPKPVSTSSARIASLRERPPLILDSL